MSRQTNGQTPVSSDPMLRSGPNAKLPDTLAGSSIQSADRWSPLIICMGLMLVVWIVFGQTLHYEFVNYDDNRLI